MAPVVLFVPGIIGTALGMCSSNAPGSRDADGDGDQCEFGERAHRDDGNDVLAGQPLPQHDANADENEVVRLMQERAPGACP